MDKNKLMELGIRKRDGQLDISWHEIAIKCGLEGKRIEEKARDLVRSYVKSNGILTKNKTVDNNLDLKSYILQDIKKPINKSILISKYKISENILSAIIEDLETDGYIIDKDSELLSICKSILNIDNKIEFNWDGDRIIRFGSIGDTHIGSKHQQLTYLNEIYSIFEKEGLDTVFHSGDISEGENMRQGHKYECFLHGSDEIEKYIIKNYPYKNGIKTKFITGNHDHSMIKSCGHDIGKVIARERKDMIYLGMSNAKINITPNCIVELNHPLDGASYALSYTLQKTIDAMSGGEKPNVLLNGHHHKSMYVFYRNIHAFEIGTYESQTPWMRGKRLAAYVGGWIITVHVSNNGTITRCIGEFIPCYKSIKDDY